MPFYLYDGTVEGFFTVLSECLADPASVDGIMPSSVGAGDLFSTTRTIEASEAAVKAVKELIGRRIAKDVVSLVRCAFYSEERGVEMALFRYLLLGLEIGKKVRDCLNDERVAVVYGFAGKVKREAHRYKGFLRFRELEEGILYAPFEPACNVLPLIGEHFVRRFKKEQWVIHDLRRKKALLGTGGGLFYECDEAAGQYSLSGALSAKEKEMQMLWKSYFTTIAITERANPACQQNHLPLKYRKHLLEMTP